MSKLFSAVQKHGGELERLLKPIVDLPLVPGSADGPENIAVSEPLPPAPDPSPDATAGKPEKQQEALLTSACRVVKVQVSEPVLPFDGADPCASEHYRLVRTHILQHPARPQVVLISSVVSGEGKTVTAANLAGVLSLNAGCRVLVVDADLRRSSLHRNFGIKITPGLRDVLTGACELGDALVRVEQLPDLYLLPAGDAPPNPAELLDSTRWKYLVQTLRRVFRFIIIDSPPKTDLTDYKLLEAVSDTVIIVAAPDVTPRKLLLEAVNSVPVEKRLGVLLNGVTEFMGWGRASAYGYSRPAGDVGRSR